MIITDNYFLINPVSGNGRAMSFLPDIESAINGMQNCHLHTSSSKGGIGAFVHKIAESGKPCRFYGVGGDGTLNEVINGAHGHENAEIGFMPAGSGNDFVRCFTQAQNFTNASAQLDGISIKIDTVSVILDDKDTYRFANMMNVGFDCNIVIRKNRSSSSYISALLKELLKSKLDFRLKAVFDDGTIFDDSALLFTLANGKYCGGGFLSSPNAELDSGLIDCAIIHKMSKWRLLSLLLKYANGTYLDYPKAQDVITYRKCKAVGIEVRKPTGVCLDGEIYSFKKAILKVEHNSTRFIIPRGSEYKRNIIKKGALQNGDN